MNSCLLYEITLLLIVSGAAFASSIVVPCLPVLVKYFHINSHNTYFLVSTFLFGYLSGQVYHSFSSQTKGYRFTLLNGYTIYAISCLLQIISIKYKLIYLFFLSRFFCALGASSGLICAFAMINTHSQNEEKSKNLISKSFISLTLCSYLSITIGGFITECWEWKYIFYIIFSISIVKLGLIYFYIPCSIDPINHPMTNFTSASKKLIKSLSNFKFLSSSLVVAFTTTSTYLYNTLGASISINIFKISPKIFGLLSIVNLVFLLLGGCVSTKIMKKSSVIYTIFIGVLLTFFPLLLLYIFHSKIFSIESHGVLFFSFISIINLGLGVIYPSASFLALNSENCSSTASSIMNFLKIGIPAVVISILGHSHIDLVNSYQYPMFVASIIAMTCVIYLNFRLKQQS